MAPPAMAANDQPQGRDILNENATRGDALAHSISSPASGSLCPAGIKGTHMAPSSSPQIPSPATEGEPSPFLPLMHKSKGEPLFLLPLAKGSDAMVAHEEELPPMGQKPRSLLSTSLQAVRTQTREEGVKVLSKEGKCSPLLLGIYVRNLTITDKN